MQNRSWMMRASMFLLVVCAFLSAHANVYTVTNTNDTGGGSWRQALTDANANSGLDTIEFNITGTGPHTITYGSALPNVTSPVFIDGYSQNEHESDLSANRLVELDANNQSYGVFFTSGSNGSTMDHMVVNNSSSHSIYMTNVDGVKVLGTYVGFRPDGTTARGGNGDGINMTSVVTNCQIGDTTDMDGCLIGNNNTIGINIASNTTSGIVVMNTIVGLDITGTLDRGNNQVGILIAGDASDNVIGPDNIISGNVQNGVEINGGSTTGNLVFGNIIGLDASGTTAIQNDQFGVRLTGGTSQNRIGGSSVDSLNVISGNGLDGIYIESSSSNNAIVGNYIGTNSSGDVAVPNLANGMSIIAGSNSILVGGPTSDWGNVISGNGLAGVYITSGTTGGDFYNNKIGVGVNGEDLGNTTQGITIEGGASGSNIGSDACTCGNEIAFNGDDGIRIIGNSDNNGIVGNSIYDNGDAVSDLGIDLTDNGVDVNDTFDPDGLDNDNQNFPELDSVTTSGANVTFYGSFNSLVGSSFRLDFFGSTSVSSSGNGEGEFFLGSTTIVTDGSGNYTVNETLPSVPGSFYFTATATYINGAVRATSEFSNAVLGSSLIALQDDALKVDANSVSNELNVLSNDASADDCHLEVPLSVVSSPSNGTVDSVGINGSIYYTPNTNYTGNDTLSYEVCCGGEIYVGSYTGNGTSLTVSGLGFQPDAVWVKSENAERAFMKLSSMAAGNSKQMTAATAVTSDAITGFTADGFTIGSNGAVNTSSVVHHFVALKESAGSVEVGSYTGDGTGTNAVTGVGFQPDYVAVFGAGNRRPVFRTKDMASGSTTFDGDVTSLTNRINSLDADGFTLGGDITVNENSQTYHYLAIKNSIGIHVGTYSGDNTASQGVSGIGTTPEYVMIKENSGDRTTQQFQDQGAGESLTFQNNGELTGEISSLDDDGFTVENGSACCNAGVAYYYLAISEDDIQCDTAQVVISVEPVVAPGGASGLSAWFKADTLVTTSGSTVTNWGNIVGNGLDEVTNAGDPQWVSGQLNFNPLVNFDSTDALFKTGIRAGEFLDVSGNTVFVVANAESGDIITKWEESGGDRYSMEVDSPNARFDFPSSAGANQAVSSASIVDEWTIFSGLADATTNTLHLNSDPDGTATGGAIDTTLSGSFVIGGNADLTFTFKGDIAEILVYEEALSNDDREKVESYLALKYGITLDQTGAGQNYVSSDGTVIFDAEGVHSGYDADIAGIGKDSLQYLNQTRSKSINATAIIEMEAGAGLDEGEYLMWGNDAQGVQLTQTTDNPSGLNNRLQQRWRVTETGDVGLVTVRVYVGGFKGLKADRTIADFVFMNGVAGDLTPGTYTTASAISANLDTVTFSGIDFSNDDFFTIAYNSNSPGGVDADLALWLRADAGVKNSGSNAVDGQTVNTWEDQSGARINDATDAQYPGPEFRDNATDNINFNPVLYFDSTGQGLDLADDYIFSTNNGMSIFVVAEPSSDAANARLLDFGNFSTDAYGYELSSDNVFGYTPGNAGGTNSNTPQTLGIVPTLGSFVIDFGNNQYTALNGTTMSTNSIAGLSQITAAEIRENPTALGGDGPFTIGVESKSGQEATRNFRGNLAEVLVYDELLSATDIDKVESYLAIKYGITKTGDYIASDGTIIWDESTHTGYNNDIAGLAYDSTSGFVKEISRSVNDGVMLTVGDAGGTADQSYLLWGSNGERGDSTYAASLDGMTSRIARAWQVERENTLTALEFQVYVGDIPGHSQDRLDYRLVRDNNADFSSVTSFYTAVSISNDTLYFNGVAALTNDYLTLALTQQAPGGIVNELGLWLAADNGAYNDAGTTLATNTQSVQEWHAIGRAANNASQSSATERPIFTSNALNYNPTIDFVSNDFLDMADGILPVDDDNYTVLAVARPHAASSRMMIVSGGQGSQDNGYSLFRENDNKYTSGWVSRSLQETTTSGIANTVNMVADVYDNTSGREIFIDGASQGAFAFTPHAGQPDDNRVGIYFDGTSFPWDGEIAEIITYNRNLSGNDFSKVQSYLAVKYGITKAGDYLSSAGTTIWDATANAGYLNDIAGIGIDETSGLSQLKSRSSNDGAMVVVDNASGIAAAEFLVWGNNGLGVDTLNTSDVPSGFSHRLGKLWQVDETGDVGTVTVKVYVGDIAGRGTATSDYTFVHGATTTMAGQTTVACSGLASDTATFTGVDFTNNDYFTLALNVVAPGGEGEGLIFWVRSDLGVTTGAGNVTTWEDQSGFGRDLAAGTGTAAFQGADGRFNDYPYVTFDADNDQLVSSTPLGIPSATELAAFFVLTSNSDATDFHTVFNFSADADELAFAKADGERFTFYDQDFPNQGGSPYHFENLHAFANPYVLDEPELVHGNFDTVDVEVGRNATQPNYLIHPTDPKLFRIANTNFSMGNSITGSSNAHRFEIAEAIVYDNKKEADELRKIHSYLALKYGLTINQWTARDYISPFDVVIYNTEGTHDDYETAITGIGRSDVQGLNQTQSKSVDSSGLIRVSNPAAMGDEEYLMWGHNGVAIDSFNTTDVPALYTHRLGRLWRADETGDVGSVTMKVYIGEIPGRSANNGDYALVRSSTTTMSGGSVIGCTGIVNDSALFVVDLADDDFFTLALNIEAPGGVVSNMRYWIKADEAVYQDNVNTPAAQGTGVEEWVDQAGALHLASQGTPGDQPLFYEDELNFNPGVRFISDDFLNINSGSMVYGDTNYTMLFVVRPDSVDHSTAQFIFNYGASSEPNLNAFQISNPGNEYRNGWSTSGLSGGPAKAQAGVGALVTLRYDNAIGRSIFIGGLLSGSDTQTGHAKQNTNHFIGSRVTNNQFYHGVLAEAVVYAEDLSTADRNKAESYLAVKYGLTKTGDYTNAAGLTIWDSTVNVGYLNDIAGIGLDALSGLSQLKSTSSNDSAVVVVDNANGISDGEFLVWGNNGLPIDSLTTNELPSGYTQRFAKVWRVDMPSTVGNVRIKFNLANYAGHPTEASKYGLLVHSSTSFSGATPQTVGISYANDTLTVNSALFTDGDYFTLVVNDPGPGGVTADLAYWLRADAGTNTTVDEAEVTSWVEQSSNATPNTRASGTAPTYETEGINFHPVVNFNGTDEYLDITDLTNLPSGATDRSFFLVSRVSALGPGFRWAYAHGTNVNNQSQGFGHFNADGYYLGFGTDLSSGSYLALDQPFMASGYFDGTNASLGKDGELLTTDTRAWNTVNSVGYVGRQVNGGEYFSGDIAEIIVFNQELSDVDQLRVQTYLGVKYGISTTDDNNGNGTAGEAISSFTEGDYISSDASTVLWDCSSRSLYHNDITAIGRDDMAQIDQKQSISSSVDGIITMGLGSIASSNSANVNSFGTDKTFMFWGNDNDDNGTIETSIADMPPAIAQRLDREWIISEVGTVGNVELQFDLTGITVSGTTAGDFTLLIDDDGDGDYNTGTITRIAASSFSSNIVTFSAVDFEDGEVFTLATLGLAPGGVSDHLQLWLRADLGTSTTADGAVMTAWNDVSNNGYQADDNDETSGPDFEESGTNFNPGTYWDGATTGLNLGGDYIFHTNSGATVFSSVTPDATAATKDVQFVVDFGNWPNSGYGFFYGSNNSGFYASTNNGGQDRANTHTRSNIPTLIGYEVDFSTDMTLSFDGLQEDNVGVTLLQLNGGEISENTEHQIPEGPFSIGRQSKDDFITADDNRRFQGLINDVIVFDDLLTGNERLRVQSYLSLKYGTTLGTPASPLSYLSSSSTTIWTASSTYQNDVAGIGRDDISVLHQKQSKAQTTSAIVTMGLGSIENANTSNSSAFSNDGDFMIWGHNGQEASATQETDVPSGFSHRMSRTWRVEETGTVGNVAMQVYIGELPGRTQTTGDFTLITNASATLAGGTPLAPSSLSNDTLYFAAIDFADGDFFSIAYNPIAPGGVVRNLQLWLKGNQGTSSTVDGADVNSWSDLSGNGYVATDNDELGNPQFSEVGINFNPSVHFNGSTDGLNLGGDYIPGENSGMAIFATVLPDSTSSSKNRQYIYDFGSVAGSGYGFGYGYPRWRYYTPTTSGGAVTVGTPSKGVFASTGFNRISFNDVNEFYQDGTLVSSTPITVSDLSLAQINEAPEHEASSGPVTIGRQAKDTDLNTDDGRFFQGQVGEVIVYDEDLTTAEQIRVQSYLAIKYGTSLGTTDSLVSYLDASGNVIWTGSSTYQNQIAGIGRDDLSGLDQKQSRSQDSASIVTMGLGAIATTNQGNANVFAADQSFMLWGNDNDDNGTVEVVTSELAGTATQRLDREWVIAENGTVGDVEVAVYVGGSGLLGTAATDYMLLIDEDGNGDFTNGTIDEVMATAFSGDTVYFAAVNFDDGEVFTLASSACAPGGVVSNIHLWLKADEGVTGTTTVTGWDDQGPNSFDATAGTGPELLPSGLNFNPVMDFDGVNERMTIAGGILEGTTKSDLFVYAITSTDVFQDNSLFQEDGPASQILNVHLPLSSTVHWDFGGTGGAERLTTTFAPSTEEETYLWSFQSSTSTSTPSGTEKSIWNNGIVKNTSSGSSTMTGAGNTFYLGSDRLSWYYDGKIAEMVVLDGIPTAGEQNRIQSYLALKYGVTLGNTGSPVSYFDASGNTIWTGSATYQNGIAGIGRDDVSCLNQKQAASQDSGAVVTMGLGSIAVSNVANANSFTANQDFMLWGHNGLANDSVQITDVPTRLTHRFSRVWRVHETGAVGNTEVQVFIGNIADKPTLASEWYLIHGSDATLANNDTLAATSISNDTLTFAAIDFSNNDFFTIGYVFDLNPIAVNDTVNVDEQATHDSIYVAANDSDPNGNLDSTTIQITTGPANGTANVVGTGFIRYSPNDDFCGLDSLEYRIGDATALFDTAWVFINVNSLGNIPSVTLTNSADTICAGTSVTYSITDSSFAGTNPTFAWFLNGGSVGTDANTYVNTSLSDDDSVAVIMTSSSSCHTPAVDTANHVITVINNAVAGTATVAPDDVCDGEAVTLTLAGSSAISYQWQDSSSAGTWADISGATTTSEAYTYALANSPISVRAIAVEPVFGCNDTSTVDVLTINPAAVGGTISGASTICSDETATLTLSGHTGTIQWQYDSTGAFTNLTGETATTYTVDEDASYSYRAILTNGSCSDTSNAVTMTVNPAAVAGVISGDGTICSDETQTLTLAGSLGTIQWQYDSTGAFTSLTGETGVTYVVDEDASYNYRAVVTNGSCTANSNTVAMTVNPEAVGGTITGNGTICSDETLTLTLAGHTGTIQWQFDSTGAFTNLTGETATTYMVDEDASYDYRAILTNGSCTDTSNAVAMTVNPAAVGGTITGNGTICSDETQTLTLAGSLGTIQWQYDSTGAFTDLTGETGVTYLVDEDASYNYRAVVTNGSCTSNSNTVAMTVNPEAVGGTITGSGTICSDETLALTLSGHTGTIQWQFDSTGAFTNLTGETATTYFVDEDASYDYRAILTNGSCTDTSNTVAMTVNPAAVAGIVTGGGAICPGDSITLNLGASTGTIQWQTDASGTFVAISSATSNSLTVGDSADYRAVLTNGACGDTSNLQAVTLLPAAVAGTVTGGDSICSYESVTLSLSVSTGTIQWQYDNAGTFTDIAGETSGTLLVSADSTEFYRAILTNGTCRDTSNVDTVVAEPDAIAGTAAVDVFICDGDNANLTLTATTGAIQWQQDIGAGFIDLVGQTTTAEIVNPSASLTSVDYRAVIDNNGCADTSNTVTLRIDSIRTPFVEITPGQNPICAGDPVGVSVTDTAFVGTPVYSWSATNGEVFGNATTATFTSLNDQDTIVVTMSTTRPCVSTPVARDTVIMSVQAGIVPNLTLNVDPVMACAYDTVGVTVTDSTGAGPDSDFIWYVNGVLDANTGNTLQLVSLVDGDSISVIMDSLAGCALQTSDTAFAILNVAPSAVGGTVSGANNVCPGDSIQLTLSGNTGSIQWQLDSTGTFVDIVGATGSSYYTTWPNDATYRVVVTNGICLDTSSTLAVTINPDAVGGVVSGGDTICSDETLALTLGGETGTIQWQYESAGSFVDVTGETGNTLVVTSDSTEFYRAIVTNGSCVDSSSVDTVVVNPAAVAGTVTGLDSLCEGSTAVLLVSPGTGTIQWQVDSGAAFVDVPGETNDSLFVSPFAVVGALDYRVIMSNGSCTDTSNVHNLRVDSTYTPFVSLTGQDTTCEGDAAIIRVDSLFAGGVSPVYNWFVNGVGVGGNVDTLSIGAYVVGDSVSLIVTASAELCVTKTADTASFVPTIVSNAIPTVVIDQADQSICSANSLVLTTNNTFAGDNPTYEWFIGGVGQSADTSGIVFQGATGTSEVVVRMVSDFACSAADTAFDTLQVTVSSTVVASVDFAQDSLVLCAGDTLTYSITDSAQAENAVFQWFVNSALISSGAQFASDSLQNGDTLRVLMIGTSSCATADTAIAVDTIQNINAKVLPTIILTGDTSICAGDSIDLGVAVTNEGSAPLYEWFINGVSQGTPSMVDSLQVSVVDGDSIGVRMTSSALCATPAQVSDAVVAAVAPLVSPDVRLSGPDTICASEEVIFVAVDSTSGISIPSYTWFVNGVNVNTGSDSLVIDTITVNALIQVEMVNGYACVAQSADTAALSVQVTGTVIPSVSIAGPDTVLNGALSQFTTSSVTNGGGNPIFEWYVNGNLEVANNTLETNTLANGDTVRLVMQSSFSCAVPDTAFEERIMIVITGFDVVADTIEFDEDTSGVTVNIVRNDNDPDNNLVLSSFALIDDADDLSVTWNGDSTITVIPDQNFNGTDFLVYELCDANSLCDRDTVYFTINPVADAPVARDTILFVNDWCAPVALDAGLLLSDVDGDLDLASFTFIDTLSAEIPFDTTGTTLSLDYAQDQAFEGADTVYFTVADLTGLIDTGYVFISVASNAAPITTLFFADSVQYEGDTTVDVSSAMSDAAPGIDFASISIDSSQLDGAISHQGSGVFRFNYSATSTAEGYDTIYYTVEDALCKDTQGEVVIYVKESPTQLILLPDSIEIIAGCFVEELDLAANDTLANPELGVTYTLNIADSHYVVVDSTGLLTITYTMDDLRGEGEVTFTYTVVNGVKTASANVVVTYVPNPAGVETMDDVTVPGTSEEITILQGESIFLDVAANDFNADGVSASAFEYLGAAIDSNDTIPGGDINGSFGTNPGELLIDYSPKVEFVGEDTLSYRVCDDRCVCDTALVQVFVIPDPDKFQDFLYQAISPNGDGKNDNWNIRFIEYFPGNSVKIFNRWGNLVYSQVDYGRNGNPLWSGESNVGLSLGDKLASGTYYVVIDLNVAGMDVIKDIIVLDRDK